jgi:pimeloyl-ACP methyl ester carboxylesterase
MPKPIHILSLFFLLISACSTGVQTPDLGGLYNALAMHEDPNRNPIIVIPGLLGSKLVDQDTGDRVWGTFGLGQVDPNTPTGARQFALPIGKGKKLKELRDNIKPDGALDRVVVNFLGIPLELNAYYNILQTLGVGGYRDEELGIAGAIDYGENHYTCFQFAYDWRRDIVESAKQLDRFIKTRAQYVQKETEKRFGIKMVKVKFDIVAHSMGGLVARYYLRYGAADLPEDGSLPKLTWAGAEHVEHLVIIGTPNAGSMDALHDLIHGASIDTLFPRYPAAVLSTMPSMYELLPRARHRPLLRENGQPVADLYDPELWKNQQWGLADPKQDPILKFLLPDIESAEQRREIALDHQAKALRRARQFTSAMDVPAKPPASLKLLLVAGDAEDTKMTAQINPEGGIKIVKTGPGDGTVLRSSALMDERKADDLNLRLVSPIHWDQVHFIFSDHLGLTKDPAFTDNVLYFLLESPRN